MEIAPQSDEPGRGGAARPRFVRSAMVGLVLVLGMLFLEWSALPVVERALIGVTDSDAPLTLAQLALDLVLSFVVALSLMTIAMRSRGLYGTAIAVVMAFMGWAAYFVEVGFLRGMLSSSYPQWYEWIAFSDKPAAFAVAWLVCKRRREPQEHSRQSISGGTRAFIVRGAKITALLCWLLVASAAGIALWRQRASVAYEVQSVAFISNVARAWRCHGVARPSLAKTDAPWTLTYAWSGGRGPGDLKVQVSSDRQVTFTRRAHSAPEPSVTTVTISPASLAAIAQQVDESGLLCLTTGPRVGYKVWDIGRYSVMVAQGTYAKTVYVDECHTVPDDRAIGQVIESIVELMKPILGPDVAWAPYGSASVKGSCGSSPEP